MACFYDVELSAALFPERQIMEVPQANFRQIAGQFGGENSDRLQDVQYIRDFPYYFEGVS